jgi:AraC family transcriptional regulator, regulatory protein of adaptative response / DNA-3-methyladenine glycosylase II
MRESGRAFSPDPDSCERRSECDRSRAGRTGIRHRVEALSAVVTTGIYCRAGCSARPRAENIRRFPLAAAAEAAGYRACLRCRPYRWPQSVGWTGPELVCRGVQLILDGALDRGTEAELGRRLGVSARHLRRLFTAELGVTPDGLARSARAHFARRLLDDTDLSVTEVAFAAGFGSLRQFNRVCREVFRASPRALRERRRVNDRLVADGGLRLRLPFRGPLDWGALVAYFAARAIPGVEHVSGDTYRRTIVIGGDPGVLELFPGGDDHLILRAHLPHWEELIHVVARVVSRASTSISTSPRCSSPTIRPSAPC